ncbi:MAG: lactate utilization protein [Thermoleophilia bacterium]
MFAEKLAAVGGRVSRVGRDELPRAVARVVPAQKPVLVTPELAGLAEQLRDLGLEAHVGTRDTADEGGGSLESLLDEAGAGVVRAFAGIVATGTLAVGPGGGNGGLLAAFPPLSIIVLDEAALRETMEDVFAELGARFSELGGEVVFVSGPSRTADIEMMSVVGVHGPTALEVFIVSGEEAQGGGR